jgi:hypothetical protein
MKPQLWEVDVKAHQNRNPSDVEIEDWRCLYLFAAAA